jgi:hypothetical protein
MNKLIANLEKFERNGKEETPGTPHKLVSEMLDKLPSETWTNPNKTFLDPSCSTGTFLLEIFIRLFKGLQWAIPDSQARADHILTNQLWGCEPYRVPFLMAKASFRRGLNDKELYDKLNLFNANLLDNPKELKDMKFDVVVMNPPYQAPQSAEGKRGGGDLLWNKFVHESITNWTKSSGHICAVHPSGWRKPPSERSKYNGLFDLMTKENHMTFLSIHNTADGQKTFGAGTRYDWYVIDKSSQGKTTVRYEDGVTENVDFGSFDWLPNYLMDKIALLLGDDGEVIYSTSAYETRKKWVNSEKDETFVHPLIHSTTKKGIRYCYSSTKEHGHFGVPKVIFGESGINDVVVDMEGKYGMTQGAMAIPVKDIQDAEKLKKFLLSDDFQSILNATKWSNFRIDWRMFKYFKKGFWRD